MAANYFLYLTNHQDVPPLGGISPWLQEPDACPAGAKRLAGFLLRPAFGGTSEGQA